VNLPDHAHMCTLPPGYFRPSEREDWFPKVVLAYCSVHGGVVSKYDCSVHGGVVSKYVRETRDGEWMIAWRKSGSLKDYNTNN
jgi:hypothetical protein